MLEISWVVAQLVVFWVMLSFIALVVWKSEIFVFIWQCTWGHIGTAVWYPVQHEGDCNLSRRFNNCYFLLTDRVTPRRQCMAAGDFRWRNMHDSSFLFSPPCRAAPYTKGAYCIRYLLLLQLDCPVYTCDQLEECDVLIVLWYIIYIFWGEGSMYSAHNANSFELYVGPLILKLFFFCIGAPAFTDSCIK
jgi:hypothetical protein